MNNSTKVDKNAAVLLQALACARPTQVTDFEGEVGACKQILNGKTGQLPSVFGLDLEVVENHEKGGPAILVVAAVNPGCILAKANLRNRHWMPVIVLYKKPEVINFGDDLDSAIIAKYLHTQPAFLEAKEQHLMERKAARDQAAQEQFSKKRALLAALDGTPVKFTPDGDLDDSIQTNPKGRIYGRKGVILRLYDDTINKMMKIKVVDCPSGHELEEAMKAGVYVKQDDLKNFQTETAEVLEGRALLTRTVREWVRKQLRASGHIPPAPVASTEEVAALAPVEVLAIVTTDKNVVAESQGTKEAQVPAKKSHTKKTPGSAVTERPSRSQVNGHGA